MLKKLCNAHCWVDLHHCGVSFFPSRSCKKKKIKSVAKIEEKEEDWIDFSLIISASGCEKIPEPEDIIDHH